MEETSLVLLPLPGAGHLVSAVELAKRLLEMQHCFSVTVLLMHPHIPFMKSAIASSSTSYVQSTAASYPRIHFIDLPLIDFPYESCNNLSSFMFLYIDNQKPHVKEAIKRTSSSFSSSSSSSPPTRIAAFIIDFFSTTMIDVGKELGIPTYIYNPTGAAGLGLMLYLPTLDVKVPCELKDYQGEVEVPGMLPLPPLVMPDPIMDKKNDKYSQFVSHSRRFREVDGLIVNTFGELEPTALKSIANGECLPDHHPTPPVYPVGPLLALDNKSQEPQTNQLMEWLDQQPPSSVVFLCFGSMGAFSVQQLKEMALALERSGHPFLWSLRCRSSVETDLEKILPDGFLARTQARGLVLQSWVPQAAILGHVAVGGFVSHCGWNSILESIWFGVPILAWPLYAEQKLNAFQLVRDYSLAVGLSMDYEKDGWVSAEELEKGVRSLIGETEEGKKVRKRAKDMAETSKKAVAQGGSSFSTLELLAKNFML
ncbi:UDP-glycosyltransferase 71K1-like protein [Cinnamomum micranthum f. kanehirae]|uniref:Glycosyltransferase n=1 Tax=Cinnamomum micranthum f. kanehirae TaxID=337451 RepID=A0A443N677_9MAGN|nr:UDP-glycosyltransferase 71K1-like protein [Cinnamomum micranthum f. kanehirae]